ncbi:cobyrinate a,c-diamide synthase [Ammoniphilus sp. YIM 78166]|uniref:cobyrinate a,c-diamide synthase n=1 Tax=Ammoniphilus sp. YIM 78166 TaxID=1644106 RepID=UPI0010705A64|nr:cobyrinate a,c-diamide synthase [Ammoniphilus sp. YIM 78166]
MAQKRIVLAGTGSGAGKTTLTIGLMAALQRKGYQVQGFKCGPDYIDPTYHTAVTGRASRNLDSWMLPHETLKEIFQRGSEGADISIIEGVMGFYDGKEATSNKGSTAEISMLTESPVILVVNCQSMARSVAAVVKGFQCLSEETRIAGVIANKVGSEGHFRIVKAAIEQECGIPVLGYLKREEEVEIPERHLGLVPSIERGELNPLFQRLADLVSATIDLDEVMKIASQAPLLQAESCLFEQREDEPRVTIAVAKDPAFHFYYPENLELLQAYGAKCVYFSPLAGESVPEEADGLYIGGGFPEEFAAELASNKEVLDSFRTTIQKGVPTLAECGGFMFLTEELVTTSGACYPMVGIIPGKVTMQKRLSALGYREITGVEGNFLLGPDTQAKGHEFHYSTFSTDGEVEFAYETKGLRGTKSEGVLQDNLVAGYTHFHFASNPQIVKNWIEKCLEVKAHV